ncbi:MAG: ribonuclease HI [Clostridiales bacterium]|nr:ribonuclease HI [Clostridiales bacterium]
MKKILIYTDGACSGNPGPGGWGAVLIYKHNIKQMSGFVNETTNNRMEIFAIIKAFSALKQHCSVEVYSDSAYVINAFNQGWLNNWENNNWKKTNKKPVENQDLWRQLLLYVKKHNVTWHKVKGHSDNEYNNLCDQLATDEIQRYKDVLEEKKRE